MASIYTIEIKVEDITCPFCNAAQPDAMFREYEEYMDKVEPYTCDECGAEFELRVDAEASCDLVLTKAPVVEKPKNDPLGTGLPDVIAPNQLSLL